MRQRTTFRDSSLRVGEASEFLLYGPESAEAYAQIKTLHDSMRQEIIKGIPKRRRAIRLLRQFGNYSFNQACQITRILYKDDPTFCDLARLGYETVWTAADTDTWTYSDSKDARLPEPFVPCGSPKEAYEKYYLAV